MKRSAKPRKFKLTKDARRLSTYWRDSLREGEQESVSFRTVSELSVRISAGDFERGHCSPENHWTLARKLAEQASGQAQKRGQVQNDENDALSVLICPLRFRRNGVAGRSPHFLEILWLPASLEPNGMLLPVKGRYP